MNNCKNPNCGNHLSENKLYCNNNCRKAYNDYIKNERIKHAPKCINPKCSNITKVIQSEKYAKYCSKICNDRHREQIKLDKITSKLGPPPKCKNPECNTKVQKCKDEDKYKTFCSRTCYSRYNEIRKLEKFSVCEHPDCNTKTEHRYCSVKCSNTDPDMQKIRQLKLKEKYGKHPSQMHISNNTLSKLSDKTYLEKHANRPFRDIATELEVSYYAVADAYKKHNVKRKHIGSAFESEVMNFIQTYYSGNIIRNSRKIISPKEIDIYIPDLDLAIECNGSFWHSELNGRGKKAHIEKTELCNEQNIHLIHVWDYHWINNRDLIKSRIKSVMGYNNRIYARQCEFRTVSSNDSMTFLKENHIQSSYISPYRYGLYYNDELVALMTFGKSRYNKKIEYELIRYCTKQNTNIVGGASKLFSKFIKEMNPSTVISYSDKSWNTGKVYKMLGFEYERTTEPAYHYTNDYITFSNRVAFQKHKLSEKLDKFDKDETEWQNMMMNGYDRIWDCGNDVWMYRT